MTPRLDRWSARSAGVATASDSGSGMRMPRKRIRRNICTMTWRRSATMCLDDQWVKLTHGDVVIAAITSCTNTSNPSVMVAAGLAGEESGGEGIEVPPYVKTSLRRAAGW